MFYALATNQEYIASKINLFIALAPIVRFNNIPLTLEVGKMLASPIKSFFNSNKIYSLFGETFITKKNADMVLMTSFVNEL